jgi:putative oxidoreductase
VISVDIASVIIRVAIGATMIAHGYNHAFCGGKLSGTARWFESIGFRPGRVYATNITLTGLCAGALLIFGVLTPLAVGDVIGTMMVTFIANHLRNGFFIFRPGEGYECVLKPNPGLGSAQRSRRRVHIIRPHAGLPRCRLGWSTAGGRSRRWRRGVAAHDPVAAGFGQGFRRTARCDPRPGH